MNDQIKSSLVTYVNNNNYIICNGVFKRVLKNEKKFLIKHKLIKFKYILSLFI